MAGTSCGKVIWRNVRHGVANRSAEASTRVRSMPVSRARTSSRTRLVLNSMCAAMIVMWPNRSLNPKRVLDEREAGREQDERGQGDHDLGHDDADVGQRIEADAQPPRDALQTERRHRPEQGGEDRVRDGHDEAVAERLLDDRIAERLRIPAQAEPGPDRRQVVGVEAEDDHDRRSAGTGTRRRAAPGGAARSRPRPPRDPPSAGASRASSRRSRCGSGSGRSQHAHRTLTSRPRRPRFRNHV